MNKKWDIMNEKMASLSQEVFDEVMEHEIALAKLESERFEDLIPQDIMNQERKSLLLRLNNIKTNLVAK